MKISISIKKVKMKARIKKWEVLASLFLWFSGVSGKVDVFCYEEDGIEPKRSDHPAYNENKYRLLSQENWDRVTAVRLFIGLYSDA